MSYKLYSNLQLLELEVDYLNQLKNINSKLLGHINKKEPKVIIVYLTLEKAIISEKIHTLQAELHKRGLIN